MQNLTPEIREQLGLAPGTRGVVVTNVDPDSPAAQVLEQSDVIDSINRHPVNSVGDFNRWAAEAKGQTLLRVNRQGFGQFIVISPSENEGADENQ